VLCNKAHDFQAAGHNGPDIVDLLGLEKGEAHRSSYGILQRLFPIYLWKKLILSMLCENPSEHMV
jgi:hypothetical protein